MTTTVNYTVKSDGSGDFTTLTLLRDALDTDITAAGTDKIIEVSIPQQTGTPLGTTWNRTLSDAAHYIRVKGTGQVLGPQCGTSQVRGQSQLATVASYVIYEDLVSVSGNFLQNVAGSTLVLRRVALSGTSGDTTYGVRGNASGAVICESVCVVGAGCGSTIAAAFVAANVAGLAVTWINCTAIGYSRVGSTEYGFSQVGSSTASAQNCVSWGHTTADYSGTITDSGGNLSGDGSLGSTLTHANAAVLFRRHPSLIFAWNGDEGANGEGPSGVKRRQDALCFNGGPWGSLPSGGTISGGVLTTTDGQALSWGFSASVIPRFGTGDRTITAVVDIAGGLANSARGIVGFWNTTTNANRHGLYVDASGYFVAALGNSAGTLYTATSTTKIGDLAAGRYLVELRLVGTDLTIALGPIGATATVEATTTVAGAFAEAPQLRPNLGSWWDGSADKGLGTGLALRGLFCFRASVQLTDEMPYFGDLTGMLALPAPTPLSPTALKNGGVAAGAPARDLTGLPLADRRRFDEASGHSAGAYGYHPTATPGGDKWGAGLISGDVVALPGPVYP